MRVLSRAFLLLAGLHFFFLTAAPIARAQPAPPSQPVQPVPYPDAPPPVPYTQPLPPGPPRAVAPMGQDVIHLKNGGILRGTIIDAIPDAQARIQLATGEIATVPWGEIASIEHAGASSRPSAPPATAQAPLPPPAPPPRPRSNAMVWVHIEGSDLAVLEIDRASDGNWQTACRSPCDVALPVAADYRIGGGAVKRSPIFQLHGNHGDHVTITVNGGSMTWLIIGVVIVPVAGLVTLVAALVGLVGTAELSANGAGCVNHTCAQVSGNASGLATAGWVTAAIGAAATIGGILLIASNAKTTVGVDVSAGPPPDAWLRQPTWHETAIDRQVPPVIGVPLLSGKF